MTGWTGRTSRGFPAVLVAGAGGGLAGAGLLVANAARRRPELVAGLVLLDPTLPEVVAFAPRSRQLARMRRGFVLSAVRQLFGAHRGPGSRAGQGCAAASVFAELSPSGSVRVGWETVVYDGDLGDLPLVLVIPRDLIGGEAVLAATQDAAEGRTDQPLLPPEPGPVPVDVDVDVVTAGAHAGGNGPRLNGHDGLSSGGDVRRDGTEASRVRV
ncbi:hypothetical protein [Streptomyces sp. NPDC090053]|uniref:hypothetical protein n=1 Tax=Streptomyces sp. NPDC090053 TaxID=3365932 RepID=UPI0038296E21